MLVRMKRITDAFYGRATGVGVHAFIEFCGLMNEFVQVCQEAHARGVNFTQANTHSGQELPFAPHHATYLAEKLNCIYGPSLLSNEANRQAFIQTLFEGVYKLVPR
jgi:hypothetical protein